MPQLHCYVPVEVADRLRRAAERAGMSVSRYLAELARREVSAGWPEGYFERVFGRPGVAPIKRPPQGDFEDRPELD